MMSINWKIVWQSRWLITLAFVLAAAISATSFLLVPRQWEALATIKIGYLSINTQASNASGHSKLVRIPLASASGIIYDVMTPAFIARASKDAGLPQDAIHLLPKEYHGYGWLAVSQLDNNQILLLVRAHSPANAKRIANEFVKKIFKNQSINTYLADKNQEIDMLRHELVRMQNNVAKSPRNYSYLNYYFYLQIQEKINKLKSELSFPFMKKTNIIQGVYVLPRAVFPRPSVFVGLGILLWLVMSVSIIFWRTKTSGK